MFQFLLIGASFVPGLGYAPFTHVPSSDCPPSPGGGHCCSPNAIDDDPESQRSGPWLGFEPGAGLIPELYSELGTARMSPNWTVSPGQGSVPHSCPIPGPATEPGHSRCKQMTWWWGGVAREDG